MDGDRVGKFQKAIKAVTAAPPLPDEDEDELRAKRLFSGLLLAGTLCCKETLSQGGN